MQLFDKLTEKIHNKEIDRRIEKAKKLMESARYAEAMEILSEGMYEGVPYKFDMCSGYRYDEIEDLYVLCNKEEFKQKREARLKKRREERNKGTDTRRHRTLGEGSLSEAIANALGEPNKTASILGNRFGRKLSGCIVATLGCRNKDLPAFGIAIANTLNVTRGGSVSHSTKDEDNLVEETIWSIPNDIVSVNYETDNRQYTHMDFRSMEEAAKILVGLNVCCAILVVDAQKGITSFEKKQVELAKKAGVEYVIVYIDNCDLFEHDRDRLEQLEYDIQDMLNTYGYPGDDTPIVYGSTRRALEEPESEWGEKILGLVEMLDEYVPSPMTDRDKSFLLPVEDVFNITNRGVVATGRVETGIIKVNDRVEIIGFGDKKQATVTGIEMFRVLKDSAEPADNVGLLLRGVEKREIKRGCVITKVGAGKCYTEFDSVIYFIDSKYFASLTKGSKVDLAIRTARISGELTFAEENKNYDGQYVEARVKLSDSVALEKGLHFAIVDKYINVIGFGKVCL